MSSFVIGKQTYVKAAGLMVGIESMKRHPHRWFLENCRKKFVEVYEMNAKSVAEQYDDEDVDIDTLTYDTLYKQYIRKGADIAIGMGKGDVKDVDDLRPMLWGFFLSVLYQIENDEMHKAAAEWFFDCINKLYYDVIFDDDKEYWWGEIDL